MNQSSIVRQWKMYIYVFVSAKKTIKWKAKHVKLDRERDVMGCRGNIRLEAFHSVKVGSTGSKRASLWPVRTAGGFCFYFQYCLMDPVTESSHYMLSTERIFSSLVFSNLFDNCQSLLLSFNPFLSVSFYRSCFVKIYFFFVLISVNSSDSYSVFS